MSTILSNFIVNDSNYDDSEEDYVFEADEIPSPSFFWESKSVEDISDDGGSSPKKHKKKCMIMKNEKTADTTTRDAETISAGTGLKTKSLVLTEEEINRRYNGSYGCFFLSRICGNCDFVSGLPNKFDQAFDYRIRIETKLENPLFSISNQDIEFCIEDQKKLQYGRNEDNWNDDGWKHCYKQYEFTFRLGSCGNFRMVVCDDKGNIVGWSKEVEAVSESELLRNFGRKRDISNHEVTGMKRKRTDEQRLEDSDTEPAKKKRRS